MKLEVVRRVACQVVALACLVVVYVGAPPVLVLDGRTVPVHGTRPTVATVLASSGLRMPPGRLYAVVSHRLLPGRDRAVAPVIRVDGRRASPNTPVRPGDRIWMGTGSAVEPTVVQSVQLTSITAGAARPTPASGLGLGTAGWQGSGLPGVEQSLWHAGAPPTQSRVVGRFSGEVVSTSPVAPARLSGPETDKVVALTFDDGPNPTWTPQVLGVLGAEHVPAMFCDVGLWVWAHPDLVRAEVAQGDTICDHTVDHDTGLDHAPHAHVVDEIGRGQELIEDAAGVPVRFYRPPGGALSPDVVATAHARGLRVVTWTVDPTDYLVPPPPVLLGRILSQVRPGAVILLHDGGGFRANTVGILPQLIDTLRAEGYRFTTPGLESPA